MISLVSSSCSLRVSLGALLLTAFASSALAQTTFTHDPAGNRATQMAAVAGPPTVALPPTNQLGQTGGTARFGVVAGGPGPFTYQWYKDTSPIIGATTDTLVLSPLAAGDFTPNPTGTSKYSVKVTNASGSVTSAAVGLYLDTNGRGLADWWQLQYFGALGVDPNADADGDGVSNLQEYRDGTAPTTGTSRHGRLALSGTRGLMAVSSPADTFAGGSTATAVAIPYGELQFGGWTGTYRSMSDTFTFGFPSGGSFVGDVVLVGLFGSLPPQETNSSPAFTNADGTPAQITGFAVAPDGSAIAFGAFNRVNGAVRSSVARLRPDGSLDANFAPAPDDLVTAAVIQPDGKIVLAGNFAAVNGQARPGVARLLASGALDTSFVPADQGSNQTQATALAVQRDGKVLYGGTLWVGANSLYLARLNSDGSLDAAFIPTLDGPLTALAVQPDTKILIGGNFTNVNGVAGYKIRRLNAAGARDPAFAVTEYGNQEYGGPTYTAPGTILVQPDGRILLGGALHVYTNLGSRFIPVSRLNADGTRDEAFNERAANTLNTFASSSLALQSDGRILGVGTFSLSKPSLVNAFRLNADGTLDPTGFAISHPDAPVNAVAIASDGSVLLGGAFTQISPGTPLPSGHAYFLTSSRLTWTQAEAQANSLGGHLVAVNSAAEQDFLFNTFVPAAAPLRFNADPYMRQYWNGLNDYAAPGTFAWTTGEPFTYNNGYQGGPSNNDGTQHAVVMNRSYVFYNGNDTVGLWEAVPDAGTMGIGDPVTLDGPYFGIIEVGQTVYGDSFKDPRAGFARMVSTNHLIPGPLGVSPAGPVFAIRPGATFTLAPQLSAVSATPVISSTLEASPDGVNFAAVATGTVDPISGACTFTVPALPAGTTYYRALIGNASQETARSYPVGPLITPPAVTSPLSIAGVLGQPLVYQGTATGPLSGFAAANLPTWATAAYDPNTGILTITGTPNIGGTTAVSLQPANAAGSTLAKLTITVPNTFSAWRTANFTAAELQNPFISGPNADPTGSGISNLLRYALGIPVKGNGAGRLPKVSMQIVGGAKYLTLTYTRDKSAADVFFAVQVSGDLTNANGWNSGTGYTTETSRTDNGDGTETVVTRDNVAQATAGRRFMRLQVSQ